MLLYFRRHLWKYISHKYYGIHHINVFHTFPFYLESFYRDLNIITTYYVYMHTTNWVMSTKHGFALWHDNTKLQYMCHGVNRSISQIPQCTNPISHNASRCNRNVHTCAHFCYKVVHCGCVYDALWDLWDGSILIKSLNRKWQDYVYIQCEYKSTKQKIKHLLRDENKVKENMMKIVFLIVNSKKSFKDQFCGPSQYQDAVLPVKRFHYNGNPHGRMVGASRI